ncbi:MAG: phosphodiester glycosidase family protein [Cyanobacteria bacterium P01_H01_bin.119]
MGIDIKQLGRLGSAIAAIGASGIIAPAIAVSGYGAIGPLGPQLRLSATSLLVTQKIQDSITHHDQGVKGNMPQSPPQSSLEYTSAQQVKITGSAQLTALQSARDTSAKGGSPQAAPGSIPGVEQRRQTVVVDGIGFPTDSFTVDLRRSNLALRPIWTTPSTVPGLTPLTTLAAQWQAAIAINAGFFNRNNRLPLGAIRTNGQWISGPILGRGAIAWSDTGEIYIGRLALEQTLTTESGQQFPIQAINSGYVQAGVGLYTPAWGAAYTPVLDNETIVVIAGNQVVRHQAGGAAGSSTVPIPNNGFVLAVRAYRAAVNAMPPGMVLSIASTTIPDIFDAYPHAVGGGPLLLVNNTVVLNPQAEQFSQAFASQSAARSAVGKTADGRLMMVTVSPQAGGRGPTLRQLAGIMQALGNTDALNLDGGNSSSLYANGTLVNRSPQSAARVNSGLGVFVAP